MKNRFCFKVRSIGQPLLISLAALAALSGGSADAATVTHTTAFSYYSINYQDPNFGPAGVVSKTTREPNDPTACSVTTYGYDGVHNVTSQVLANCSGATGLAVFQQQAASASYAGPTGAVVMSAGVATPVTIANGTFASSVSMSNGVANTTSILTRSIVRDPRFGTPLSGTSADLQTTTWATDDFGRIVRKVRADKTSVVTAYCILASSGLDQSSNSASCTTLTPVAGEVPADAVSFVHREPHDTTDTKNGGFERVYTDAVGRAIRVATEAFDGASQPAGAGNVVVRDTVYNDQGLIVTTTAPYFLANHSSKSTGSNDMGATRTDYDVLGRVTAEYVASSSGSAVGIVFAGVGTRRAAVSSISYQGSMITTTNDLQQRHVDEYDAAGELVRVTDNTGAQTARQYDASGHLVRTIDALQNQVVIGYDAAGRRTSLTDPDAGVTGYCYDAADQLRAQQSAKMRGSNVLPACPAAAGGAAVTASSIPAWTTFAYDWEGRTTQRIEPEMSTTWSYDSCTTGKDKLCEVKTTNQLDRTFAYDSTGRIASSKTAINAGPTWAASVAYDATTGRVASQTWPSGLTVSYGYTKAGFPKQVLLATPATVGGATLPSVLWSAGAADARGASESETLGNGVVSSVTFDPSSGYPTAIRAATATESPLDQAYTWDSIGRMSTRGDNNGDGNVNTGSVTETFQYDDVQRLTQYTVAASRIPNFSRSVALQYNAIGNMLYKTDVGNYSYPASGGTSPHAASAINGTSYGYDLSGNLLTASAGPYRSLSYTSFNQPSTATGGAANYSWQYDETHQRIVQSEQSYKGTRTTWYAHPDNEGGLAFEHVQEVDGTQSNRHFIAIGAGESVVMVSSGALPTLGTALAPTSLPAISLSKVEYWHSDVLGSLIGTTDQNGHVTARYAYDPFGKRRYADGRVDAYGNIVIDWVDTATAGTGRGFSQHEQLDDIGLVNMNGRMFDPMSGRFLQADPYVQAPHNLQSFNRYAYCMGNPLNCRDPSGYEGEFGSGFGDSEMSDIGIGFNFETGTTVSFAPQVMQTQTFYYSTAEGAAFQNVTITGHHLTFSELFPGVPPRPVPAPQPFSWAAFINAAIAMQPQPLANTGSGGNAAAGGGGGSAVSFVSHGTAPPPVTVAAPPAPSAGNSAAHTVLDVASAIPGLNIPLSLVSAAWSFKEGDYTGGTLSMAGAIPFFGEAATAAKIARNASRAETLLKDAADVAKACGSTCSLGREAAADAAKWSSKSVKSADQALANGASSVTVNSRAEAEELFLGVYQGQGYRNATGFDGVGTKQYFGTKAGTYHWDDVMGADGFVAGHAPSNPDALLPHLQIAPIGGGSNIHIFFPW